MKNPCWLIAAVMVANASAHGQGQYARVDFIGEPGWENERSAVLRADGRWSMFQSASSGHARGDSAGWTLVLPHLRVVNNSSLPYSMNDGALWAGRGVNTDVVLGGIYRAGRFRLALLPEAVTSRNADYVRTAPDVFPPFLPDQSGWASPFHLQSQRIDLPIRFGNHAVRRLFPGQSALTMAAGPVEFGAATENEWWGPGIRNALLLSNNAAGFPHLLIRTASPVETPIGKVEARWLAGGLTRSEFFDTAKSDYLRRVSLIGATIEPRGLSNVTVGAARAVYGEASGWANALSNPFDVFRNVGTPDARAVDAPWGPSGADQLLSLFLRWAEPSDGFEAYAEWGRAEFPKSLRDFLVEPNHTQGYTVGLQWLGEELARTRGRIRVQAEATFLQQSSTYQSRPIGSWYTSSSVRAGYTEQGQVLGAAIGPGSSSQWVAIDHMGKTWNLGGYVNRIRWLEDARSQAFGGDFDMTGWCEHDVSLLGGIRALATSRFGNVSADYSTGWRYNVFFTRTTPMSCPDNKGRDERNKSLTMTFSPAALRW